MSNEQFATLTNSQVFCDTETCDYVFAFEETPSAEELVAFVGAPCPKCGAPLLTKEQFEKANRFRELVDALNALKLPVSPEALKVKASVVNGEIELLAAAPEMYEALREAIIEVCRNCDSFDFNAECASHPDCGCFALKWRDALKKARGGA